MNNIQNFVSVSFSRIKIIYWIFMGLLISYGIFRHFFYVPSLLDNFLAILFFFKATSMAFSLRTSSGNAFYNNNFSLKYLLSIPMDKANLLTAILVFDMIVAVPFATFFVIFQDTILECLSFGPPDSMGARVASFLNSILFWGFLSISGIRTQILIPRKRAQRSNFLFMLYQMRLVLTYALCLAFFITVASAVLYMIWQYAIPKNLRFLSLNILKNHWCEVLIPISISVLAYWYKSTVKILQDESIGYVKPLTYKKELSLFFVLALILLAPAAYVEFVIPSEFSGNLISEAIYRNSQYEFNEALKNAQDLDRSNSHGLTPIMVAAWLGNYKAYQLLKSKGAKLTNLTNDQNEEGKRGLSIFMLAVKGGNIKIVQDLLNEGFTANETDKYKLYSALDVASYSCYVQIIDLLVERGADVNKPTNKSGKTPLTLASWQDCVPGVVLLTKSGADINHKDTGGKTAIQWVNIESVKGMEIKNYLEGRLRTPASTGQ